MTKVYSLKPANGAFAGRKKISSIPTRNYPARFDGFNLSL